MTSASDFVKALRKVASGDAESVAQARVRRISEWTDDLRDLAAMIARWLEPVVEAGLATIIYRDYELTEPDVGTYQAPGLEVDLLIAGEKKPVLVRPRGLQIVGIILEGSLRITGANGRVDVECGVMRDTLLRFKNDDVTAWQSFGGGEQKVLTEEVFFASLAKISGLEPR